VINTIIVNSKSEKIDVRPPGIPHAIVRISNKSYILYTPFSSDLYTNKSITRGKKILFIGELFRLYRGGQMDDGNLDALLEKHGLGGAKRQKDSGI
jgi:hypothetical protein